ncbi:MAG: hypothetical protein ACRD1W_08780 [Vicinamibacterales bacterium]
MTPSEFSFKLSVPNDPQMASIVGDMARHAAEYAKLEDGATKSFCDRALAAAGKMLEGDDTKTMLAVFTAADGALTLTLGAETISELLSSS